MGEDEGAEPDYEVDNDPACCRRLDTAGVPVTVTVAQVRRAAPGWVGLRRAWVQSYSSTGARPCGAPAAGWVVVPRQQCRACQRCPASPQVGGVCGVDLSAIEERCVLAAVQVAVDPGGRVCGLTKRGQKGIDPGLLLVSPPPPHTLSAWALAHAGGP
jgi:hypothetical protein